MRLDRLEFKNYCQHEDMVLEFDPGLTAIVGRNGAGKSNVVYGLLYVLTGESGQHGKKDENIRIGSSRSADSYVALTFNLRGHKYYVERRLRPATKKTKMVVDDDEENAVFGDNPVTDALQKLLGVGPSAIEELHIIVQESLFEFLSKTPAKRLAAWERILQFDALEAARASLEKHAKQYPAMAAPDEQRLAAADTAVLTAEAEYSFAREEDSRRTSPAELKSRADELRRQQANYDAYQRLAKDYTEAYNRNLQVADQYRKISEESQARQLALQNTPKPNPAELQRLQQKYDLLRTVVPAPAPAVYPERPVVPDVEALRADPECADLIAAWDRAYPADFDFLSSEDGKLVHQLRQIASFRQRFADGSCPTCNQPVNEAPSTEVEFQLATKRSKITSRAGVLKSYVVESDRLRAVHAYAQLQHENSIKKAIEGGIKQSELVSIYLTQQDLEQAINAQSLLVKQHQVVEQTAMMVAKSAEGKYGELAQTTEAANRLYNALQEYGTMPADVGAELATADAAVAARTQQLMQVESLRVQAEAARRMRDELQDLVKKAASTVAWANQLSGWQSMLAPSALPKAVLHKAIQPIVPGINRRLAMAGADFVVDITPELDFQVTFNDGVSHPDKRLSIGQKDLLGLAFRLTLPDTLETGLRILVLDEPTADLDVRYRDRVLTVIDHLRDQTYQTGLQVIVVTHSPELANRCNKVIEIGAGE